MAAGPRYIICARTAQKTPSLTFTPLMSVTQQLSSNGCFSGSTVLALSRYTTIKMRSQIWRNSLSLFLYDKSLYGCSLIRDVPWKYLRHLRAFQCYLLMHTRFAEEPKRLPHLLLAFNATHYHVITRLICGGCHQLQLIIASIKSGATCKKTSV
jgi:hypothetical protein